MGSWVYNNFQQQPSFGATFEEAFKRGYGMMDTIYQQQRQNQLRSKLADLYVANPDMTPLDRMKKTVPLMALYGDMNKAVEMDKAVQQAEFNQLYKTQMLGLQTAKAEAAASGKPKDFNIYGNLVRVYPDGSTEQLGKWNPQYKPSAPKSGAPHWKAAINPETNGLEYYDQDAGQFTGIQAPEAAINPVVRGSLAETQQPAVTTTTKPKAVSGATPKAKAVDKTNPLGLSIKKKK